MNKDMEDWVLIEAAKRCDWAYDDTSELQQQYKVDLPYAVICDMIHKHEQPPVDRKLLCAKEAINLSGGDYRYSSWFRGLMQEAAVRAIELWEEGFGK